MIRIVIYKEYASAKPFISIACPDAPQSLHSHSHNIKQSLYVNILIIGTASITNVIIMPNAPIDDFIIQMLDITVL